MIVKQIIIGLSCKEIARNLCRSHLTIAKHRENIYSKLEIHSRFELYKKIVRE
ncbi:LuxR C-terminal-related transcriptional regulator [Orbus sturtevantii]|uniref:LuxR C-terminal-related transcriptional regulator n=1 Tax=Orbus sturtevantii TaxID=3074109 RepID=UPI00370DC072